MHDGSLETLQEVVEFYDTGFVERKSLDFNMKRLNLKKREVDDIVAFLETLKSDDEPVTIPDIP